MEFYDHHVHTSLCNHASGTMLEFAKAANRLGLAGIGFSDHSPILEEFGNKYRMLEWEMEIYVEAIFSLRERFDGEIQIKLGMELEYIQEAEKYLQRIVKKFPFDYLIGSVHLLSDHNGKYVYLSKLRDEEARKSYQLYFEKIKQAARSGLFDIVAHFDLPKKFWDEMQDEEYEIAAMALEEIKNNDLSIEVNTSGLRTDEVKEPFPNKRLIQIAHNLGIPLVIGSDSHLPHDVGSYFEDVVSLLKELGVAKTTTFHQRKRIELLI